MASLRSRMIRIGYEPGVATDLLQYYKSKGQLAELDLFLCWKEKTAQADKIAREITSEVLNVV